MAASASKMKYIFWTLMFTIPASLMGQPNSLFDHSWELNKLIIDGQEFEPPESEFIASVTLQIQADSPHFHTQVCNQAFSTLRFDGDSVFAFTENMYETLIVCVEENLQPFENRYLDFYRDAKDSLFYYTIQQRTDGGDSLVITNHRGEKAIYRDQTSSWKVIDKTEILVYPNPVQTLLTIEVPDGDETSYQLFDASGHVYDRGVFGSGMDYLFMEEYLPGLYYLQLSRPNFQGVVKILKY